MATGVYRRPLVHNQRAHNRARSPFTHSAPPKTVNAELSDNLVLVEALQRDFDGDRLLADSLILTESLIRPSVFDRVFNDSFTFSDTLSRFGVFTRNPSDSLALTENLTRSGVFTRFINTVFTLTENLVAIVTTGAEPVTAIFWNWRRFIRRRIRQIDNVIVQRRR